MAFKVISLDLNALFQSLLPRFHALLEGFLRDGSKLSHHGRFNGFRILKTSSFDDFLEFGKQKEVARGPIWRVGWLLQYSNVIIGKKLQNPSRHYELEHCHDEAAMTSFPTVLFFSPSLSASDVVTCFCRRAD